MISRNDIQKLAALARMKLTDQEEEKFTKEIDSILGYVATIQNVSGTAEAEVVGKNKNTLREDTHPHESGIHTQSIIHEAPRKEGDYIKVKKVL